MPKLPFDQIRDHADALLDKVLSAKTEGEAHEMYNVYTAYLEACGYTLADYDAEISKRLDQMVPPEGWEEPKDPFKQPTPKKILN